jgi:DNA-binding NarL/FixJ family response regulator
MTGRIRLLVVDDHALVREGLTRLFEQVPNVEQVGQAATAEAALALAEELQPDVALVDLHTPQLDGIETARRLRETCPSLRILILSGVESEDGLLRAVRAGTHGYILKTLPFAAVVRAIEMAMDGNLTLPHDLARRIFCHGPASNEVPGEKPAVDLTERERQILRYITEGESNRQIAVRLVISEHTVRAHVRNLMHKLGVGNRAQAAAVAARHLAPSELLANGVAN